MDDVFCIWTHRQEKLNDFFTYLNSCSPSIKFTLEVSRNSVNFLDTTVSITADDSLKTDLFCKPTDAHNYLLYSSAHPRSCKTSIPYSQFLRIRRICTHLDDFDKHAKIMGTHFLRRGYPLHLIEEAVIKVRRMDRTTLLTHRPTSKEQDDNKIILVTRYNPHDNIVRNLAQKNWDLLGKSTKTHFLHEKKLMTAYKRPQNIRDLIVRADCQIKQPTIPAGRGNLTLTPKITTFFTRATPMLSQVVASSSSNDLTTSHTIPLRTTNSLTNLTNTSSSANACKNKRCRYCPHLDKSGQITSTTSGELFSCKTNISCRSSNLIYSITCQKCNKQYVGQTKRKLGARFQGHFYKIKSAQEFLAKSSQNNATKFCKDAVGLHFSKPDHRGTPDLKIQVLDFIHLPPHSERSLKLRLKIEKSWIHRLRCTAPHGLNIFD